MDKNKIGDQADKAGDTPPESAEVMAAQAIAKAQAPATWLGDVELASLGDKIAGEPATWYRYVQDIEKETTWRAVESARVARYLADMQSAFSSAMLTTWTEDQPDDALYICDAMYWDIDRPDIEEAITAAARLVGKLTAHGVPVEAIKAHCSGGKGFHIEVPLAAFLPQGAASLSMEELRVLPAIFKEIAYTVFVDGVDPSVYNAKRGRQWRRAGIVRKNGTYKVPVAAGDIAALTPESYAELVSEPREPVVLAPVAWCADLNLIWVQASKKVREGKRKAASRKAVARADMTQEHVERLQSALEAIDPDCEYLDWFRIGTALHDALGDDGLMVWDAWSRQGSKYKDGDCADRWKDFYSGMAGGATDATVYMLARQAGWRDPAPWLNPARDVTVNPDALPRTTDAGMAAWLAAKYGERLLYVEDIGKWAIFDGRRWSFAGDIAPVAAILKDARRDLQKAIANIQDDDQRVAVTKWALYLESARSVNNIASLLKLEASLRVGVSLFDAPPYLLNLENGVLDLKNGELLPHAPGLLLSQMAHVSFDPDAICPRFNQFLQEVTCYDADLATYIQTVLGYSLSADISAHCFWVLPGAGSNGKSALLNTVHGLMGDYATTLNVNAIMVRRQGGPEPELVKLRGARFVRVSEPSAGHQFNESVLKDVASGDPLQVRDMYAGAFELRPVAKLFVATNWKPTIAGTDEGIWRRVNVVPFNASFRGEAADARLPEKLAQERAGILNWLLRGFQRFQAGGLLERPRAVIEATEGYREELDIVGNFIRECLALDDREAVLTGGQEEGRVPASLMYAAYQDYCRRYGLALLNHNRFGGEMLKRIERTRTERGYVYKGCRLWRDAAPEREAERLAQREIMRAVEDRPALID